MKWFLKMAEIARDRNKYGDEFCDMIAPLLIKAEIFVFNQPGQKAGNYIEDHETLEGSDELKAPPFACFFIEEKSVFMSLIGDWIVLGLLINEREPGVYDYYGLFNKVPTRYLAPEEEEYCIMICPNTAAETDTTNAWRQTSTLINRYIDTIHNGKEGTEKVKKFVNFGKNRKQKQVKKISRVIHIRAKADIDNAEPCQPGRHIDWSHAWLVRGHWRTIKGIGKDRAGNYCIEGKTFVNPFQKGTGDLVHKTRIVEK